MTIGAMVFLILLGLAVLGVGLWYAYHLDQKRQAAFRVLADKNGWHYSVHDDGARPNKYKGFQPFGQGGSRKARHIVTGPAGKLPFEAFSYQYTVQTGKSSHTYHFSVAVCPVPYFIDRLTIEREHFGHKIFDALGGEDIDFESDEFSRMFWVRSSDRRQAYDVVHGQMMDYLMARKDAGQWQWRGATLMLHKAGHLKPDHVEGMVASLAGFVERLPRHRLPSAKRRG